jgi:hemerythrin
LQDLIDDAIRHFLHEEKLLKEWQYPDVENHALTHAQITGVLHDIMANLTHMSTDYQWIDAGLKIKKILIDHMLTEDMSFVEYYRTHTAVPTAGRA